MGLTSGFLDFWREKKQKQRAAVNLLVVPVELLLLWCSCSLCSDRSRLTAAMPPVPKCSGCS